MTSPGDAILAATELACAEKKYRVWRKHYRDLRRETAYRIKRLEAQLARRDQVLEVARDGLKKGCGCRPGGGGCPPCAAIEKIRIIQGGL